MDISPTIPIWLVVSTPLKNISQLGLFFPMHGQIKNMFQTTNQLLILKQHQLLLTTRPPVLLSWRIQWLSRLSHMGQVLVLPGDVGSHVSARPASFHNMNSPCFTIITVNCPFPPRQSMAWQFEMWGHAPSTYTNLVKKMSSQICLKGTLTRNPYISYTWGQERWFPASS